MALNYTTNTDFNSDGEFSECELDVSWATLQVKKLLEQSGSPSITINGTSFTITNDDTFLKAVKAMVALNVSASIASDGCAVVNSLPLGISLETPSGKSSPDLFYRLNRNYGELSHSDSSPMANIDASYGSADSRIPNQKWGNVAGENAFNIVAPWAAAKPHKKPGYGFVIENTELFTSDNFTLSFYWFPKAAKGRYFSERVLFDNLSDTGGFRFTETILVGNISNLRSTLALEVGAEGNRFKKTWFLDRLINLNEATNPGADHTDKEWKHYAIKLDSGYLYLYIDGTMKGRFPVGDYNLVSQGKKPVVGEASYGAIRELAIYKTYALSDEEIAELANGTISSNVKTLPIAYYPMNGFNGTSTLTDMGLRGNDATIKGYDQNTDANILDKKCVKLRPPTYFDIDSVGTTSEPNQRNAISLSGFFKFNTNNSKITWATWGSDSSAISVLLSPKSLKLHNTSQITNVNSSAFSAWGLSCDVNAWNHIVLVIEDVYAPGKYQISLYVNGILHSKQSQSNNKINLTFGDYITNVRVGKLPDNASVAWDAEPVYVRGLSMFRHKLSSSDITALSNEQYFV